MIHVAKSSIVLGLSLVQRGSREQTYHAILSQG